MTHKDIKQARKRLIEIKDIKDSGERNIAFIELGKELGAVGCPKDMSVGERDAEHVRSIHQALQTATMIDMCKIANRNFIITLVLAGSAMLSALGALILAFK
jgi:hypothetical protein